MSVEVHIFAIGNNDMSTVIPNGGMFKALEGEAKAVQSELNDLQKKYDMIFLDSQFRDKINGTVLCALVYLTEKPKRSTQPVAQQTTTVTANASKNHLAASKEITAPSGVKSDNKKDDKDDAPWHND